MQTDSMSLRRGIGHLLDPGLEQRPGVMWTRPRLGMELERPCAQPRQVEPLDGTVIERDVRDRRRLARAHSEAVVLTRDKDPARLCVDVRLVGRDVLD